MYHLTTHAFFKALLFLAAGSVIHGTHEQDIRKLGGLWSSMRATSIAFLIGGLALCGIWPFSGFFSKDEILLLAKERHLPLYILGTLTAGLTAFYTARAWFVAFLGKGHGHPHESGPVMLAPLALLALLSVGAGFFGIPHFLGAHHGPFHWDVALLSSAAVLTGLALAWLIYHRKLLSAERLAAALALPHTLLTHRYYLDDLYDWYVARIQQRLIAGACAWVEQRVIIEGLVNGIARLTASAGALLRLCQTGRVQHYVLGFFLGVIFLLTLRGGR